MDHVARAQDLARNLALELDAIIGVVDAIGRESGGKFLERNVLPFGDVPHRGIDLFVRYLDAGAVGVLGLNFLEHQTLEHLRSDHVLIGQWHILAAQSRDDLAHLLVELALEHDAIVDDRDDAFEHLAMAGELLPGRHGAGAAGGKRA